MKKLLNLTFLLILLAIHWNCKETSDSKEDAVSETKIDTTVIDTISSKKIELTHYDKKWVRYVDENGQTTSEVELYISEYGDSISWNRKIFKNGILDLTNSNFYDFEAEMLPDSLIKGRITLHSELDHSLKGAIRERELTVEFVNKYRDKKEVIVFESKNKNFIDFEFKNNSDTIIGLITEYRRVDLTQKPDSTRMIWTKLPVDNKSSTNNIFIHFHELGKNKRKNNAEK